MSYIVNHLYLDKNAQVSIVQSGNSAKARYSASGKMAVRHPGKFLIRTSAQYIQQVRFAAQPDEAPRWRPQTKTLPLKVVIKTPDGQVFNSDRVTLNDLKKYRDLRGTSIGTWSYNIFGESEPITIVPDITKLSSGKVHTRIALEETVASKSAAPLIKTSLKVTGNHSYSFDLFRVGKFVATVNPDGFLGGISPRPIMSLEDPDGQQVATSSNGRLIFPVTLRTLNKSRDAKGKTRNWVLNVRHNPASTGSNEFDINATVLASHYIQTAAINQRINTLLGVNGRNLSLYGEVSGSDILGRLKILDEVTAEIIDMHGLLDSIIEKEPQDKGVDTSKPDIKKDVAYTIASFDRDLGKGLKVNLEETTKVNTIKISIGSSSKIQPSIPALKIEVETQGEAVVEIAGFNLATVKVRNNRVQLEAGLQFESNGSFKVVPWVNDKMVDIDVHWQAALTAGVLTGGLILLGLVGLTEYIEEKINDSIQSAFSSLLTGIVSKVPSILAMILGDEFTHQALRLDGEDIVFDYIAPLEPDPKPTPGYIGVIGRSATELGPGLWNIMPRTLGDTWKNDNLSKIDHIVVVIMENRSFDHVLGYLAELPGHEDSDGLSPELKTFLESKGYPVGKLNKSGIKPNTLNYKTRFPASVGHEFADVTEQLSEKIITDKGRSINSPKGFISNFESRAKGRSDITVNDVLGYYEANDLPFYKFLAENYAYCERFFCSHPGPTLPNRMFSLTGDLQYDRTGEIILDNNDEDNFSLSRAMTIFDLLSRKGVDWRVYESYPSVTMLRMFARYATDNSNIVNISKLKQDVSRGDLPAVTFIEPAMHHYPENDDHSPVADMYNGQLFLKNIYDTLKSNEQIWQKTMLVITYDEHGGFYDHVIPPIADIRTSPTPPVLDPGISTVLGASNQEGQAIERGVSSSLSLQTGFGLRVPTFVVSPWTPAGKGPNLVLDFCSILKTIVARFCAADKPFVSDRVNASNTFNAFLSENEPRMSGLNSPPMKPLPDEPTSPKVKGILTPVISRKEMRAGKVDYHDLTGRLGRLLGR